MPNQENDFYKELDKDRAHQSCCTCQTLTILLIAIFVVLAAISLYFYWQISKSGIMGKIPINFNSNINNIKDNTVINSNGEVTLKINDYELNQLLSSGINFQSVIIREPRAEITTEELIIYGKMIKPLNTNITAFLEPKIKEGRLAFTLKKIQGNNYNLPTFVASSLEPNINKLLDQKMADVYKKYSFTNIILVKGQLSLVGHEK